MWKHAVYPVSLLFSIACMAWIDRTHQLAFWQNARQSFFTITTAVVYFVAWDVSGIKLSIFYSANSIYRSGVMLGQSFPIEELLFLFLLCYTILLFWAHRSRSR